MKKNLIKKIAEKSYSRNHLDSNKVAKIATSLKREYLKIYIKEIKMIEAKKTVSITLPSVKGISEMRSYFLRIYPGKRIVFNVDESLLAGIKVVDFDNVYELSLKRTLEGSIERARND